MEELLQQNHPFWKSIDLRAIRQGSGKPQQCCMLVRLFIFSVAKAPWKPKRGSIYAARQQEIAEHDDFHQLVGSRKVKLKKEDEIQFAYFVDNDMHQADILKIVHKNTKVLRLLKRMWNENEPVQPDETHALPCCVIA